MHFSYSQMSNVGVGLFPTVVAYSQRRLEGKRSTGVSGSSQDDGGRGVGGVGAGRGDNDD